MISYMVGKLIPNPTHYTRGLVKYVPGRGYFGAVPSQNGYKLVTIPSLLSRRTGRNQLNSCLSGGYSRRFLRLHYTRLFPDPRFLFFVLQNIAGYKNAVECLIQ